MVVNGCDGEVGGGPPARKKSTADENDADNFDKVAATARNSLLTAVLILSSAAASLRLV